MLHLANSLRRAFLSAMANDCFNIAQATAYSAIFALFPALIVAAALVGLIPGDVPLRTQISDVFSRILPSNAIPLLSGYFANSDPHSHHVLWSAVVVSVIGSAGVIATLMDGFRRAYRRPLHQWGFWHKRRISLMLVPMSLFPLAIISILVVFGHYITVWLWYVVTPWLRVIVIVLSLVIRWVVAILSSVSVIAVVYYKGTPVEHSFRRTLPGATIATALWFLSTLGFGLYVTRFANYTQVYGSLGAGIALLVWLYIIALSVLIGAEFNAQLFGEGYNFPGYGETLRRIVSRNRLDS
ncbi:MAG TPA: YihY/virulence factor BrkB family protein [Acidobacteriaceae bacterium]